MILILDNYDSFTYNLVQLVGSLGLRPAVLRNDETTVEEIRRLRPWRMIVSPGPGTPERSGVTLEAVRALAGELPIFGVCLGMQAIAAAFGGRLRRADRPMHGKTSRVTHDGSGCLAGLPSPFEAMRYHSLVVTEASLPAELRVTARSESGEIMGLRHARLPLEGVQFHPESYRTPVGARIVERWTKEPPSFVR